MEEQQKEEQARILQEQKEILSELKEVRTVQFGMKEQQNEE